MSEDKKRISITVDPEVYEKAKEAGLNLSKTCENVLKAATKNVMSIYSGNEQNSSFSPTFFEGAERPKKKVEWRRGWALAIHFDSCSTLL
ncbi:hypothetical protein AKJ41_01995 [candidate division MSBL1 archaeon SCGC-AAA259O05]|uniref:Antitoxin n=1 Tax=candidate division MSBL1 archaeon SCGC-AAA259O05 TaxID=1698271 RepID=A0A133V4D2_9EURY|nr:hypothetical protein AKJ41_01995 [candidate division MSBL1 archaeon SCGC-AAA259O05]